MFAVLLTLLRFMRECVQCVGGQEDKSHPKPAIELTKSHSLVPFVRSLASGFFIARMHLHKSSYLYHNNNIPHPLISIPLPSTFHDE
jgi:hypothetical protein